MIGMPLPEWKQLLQHRRRNINSYFNKGLLFSKSCMSIAAIIKAYRKIKETDKVSIWIPYYFCNETLCSFSDRNLKVCFYSLDDNLDPKWNEIRGEAKKKDVNLFLFVHYFGKFHSSINDAKVFCKSKKAILIEDCAHILYSTGKVGKSGDFVLYSPHKHMPIEDGAVLLINKNTKDDSISAIQKALEQDYCLYGNEESNKIWQLKRIIQKILHVRKKNNYKVEAFYGRSEYKYVKPKRISKKSYEVLCDYDYNKLKKIAYIKRSNLKTMNYIMSKLHSDVRPLIDESVDTPYLAVYSLEKVANKKREIEKILKEGFLILHWPDLPPQIKNEAKKNSAEKLSENIFVIPIHQDLTPEILLKKYLKKNADNRVYENIEIDWIKKSDRDRERYNEIIKKVQVSVIPQEWDYGMVKSITEESDVIRGIVSLNGNDIGVIQGLLKKKKVFVICLRINRGPLLIDSYNTIDYHVQIMNAVKKKYYFIPIVYAPNLDDAPKIKNCLRYNGWKCINMFSFSSALIDLYEEVEQIRANLDGKWRNQLKSSEAYAANIKIGNDHYNEILDLYEIEQAEKGFVGTPRSVLEKLAELKSSPIKVFYITNESNKIIAFDIFYFTDVFALYFVGWNSLEGRKIYANNLLLFNAVIYFKHMGLRWFDLGGINYIDTEENARFKDGMNPKRFVLAGEYIKL